MCGMSIQTPGGRLTGVDAVINTVGILREGRGRRFAIHDQVPRALFAACPEAGVRRAIQVSALGADASAASRFHLSKRAADDFLATLDLGSSCNRPLCMGSTGPVVGCSAGHPMIIAQ
jgi:uncharacterized protein YbjT (DUF2867 family)